jgi:hypothetical protein
MIFDMDKRFFSSSKFSIWIWSHLFTEYGVNIFSGLKRPGGDLTANLRLIQRLSVGAAIPLFPHVPSRHLIKLRGHRAFKIQNIYRVPYNFRQKYSKQFLSAGKEIFCETRKIMVFCGMTPCSLAVMYSFGGTYSLLQSASHGCNSFLGIVGVYQTTRRHTLKETILACPTLKGL